MGKKIDIFTRGLNGNWVYECSCNWYKTCKQAKQSFMKKHYYLDASQVKASFSKGD